MGARKGVGAGRGVWVGGRDFVNWIGKIKDLSHIQDLQELIRRISRFFWHASFPTFSILKILRSRKLVSPPEKYCLDVLNNLVGPKSKIMVSRSCGHAHANFFEFWKVKVKSY